MCKKLLVVAMEHKELFSFSLLRNKTMTLLSDVPVAYRK